MMKVTTAKLVRRLKLSASKEEKAYYFMGQIAALCALEDLFKRSTHKDASLLADLMELRARQVRKALRKL